MGVFLEQNGGGLTNEEGTEATVDSPENVEALTFVQEMMQDGVAAYSWTSGPAGAARRSARSWAR